MDRCFEYEPTTFDTRSKLFLFLSRMSGGDRMKRGVSDCGMSASTISSYFREIQSKMAKLFSHVICWPNKEERALLASHIDAFPGCIGMIDGTHLPCNKPLKNENIFYSGKSKFHSINSEVVCSWTGRIIPLIWKQIPRDQNLSRHHHNCRQV